MAADNSPGQVDNIEFITVIRTLEYYGPKKWVEETLRSSRVPPMGAASFPAGAHIRSGIVQWEPLEHELQREAEGAKGEAV